MVSDNILSDHVAVNARMIQNDRNNVSAMFSKMLLHSDEYVLLGPDSSGSRCEYQEGEAGPTSLVR